MHLLVAVTIPTHCSRAGGRVQGPHQRWTAFPKHIGCASHEHPLSTYLFIQQTSLLCSVLELVLKGSMRISCPHGAASQEGKTTKPTKVRLLW